MLVKTLTHDGHSRHFVIRRAGADGWEVREEQDSLVVRHARYNDWHRVERARAALELEATLLERDGWIPAGA